MTRRYNTYDEYSMDDERRARRQQTRRVSGNDMAGHAASRSQRSGAGAGGSSSRYDNRTAADYSRSRYGQQPAQGGQRAQRPQDMRAGQRSQRPQGQRAGEYYDSSRQQQRSAYANRRQVELNQSGAIPRYQPQNDPRTRQQVAAQRNQAVAPASAAASRYARANSGYQARPSNMSQMADTAGALTSPISYIVRLVIIVVLAAVFAVTMITNNGTVSQLNSVKSEVTAAQENLDSLNSQNQELQSSIDSRQETIDEYNKLVAASSS